MASCGGQMPAIEEPLSPTARLFHLPGFNCCIMVIIGSKTSIDPVVIKAGLQQTLVHHPRFSSKVVMDGGRGFKKGGEMRWVPTKVNVEEHVIVPDLNPDMPAPDAFVEDYVSDLTRKPVELSRPLWEIHLLNVRTSDAAAVAVLRVHHSLGDGASLISLLLACTRKSSAPQAIPTLPTAYSSGQAEWSRSLLSAAWAALRLAFNTLVDFAAFAATCAFLTDTETPIKGRPGVELAPKRFVHRNLSLEDIKMVKKALNTTINDVLLGVTEAGLSRYLNNKYAESRKPKETRQKTVYLPESILMRATVYVNVRPAAGIQELADMMAAKSQCKWGNSIGYVLVPLSITLRNDPLDYIRKAKAVIDRKKLSLEAKCSFRSAQMVYKLFGKEAAAALSNRVISNTTLGFSNVVGPSEEISFYGHPIAWFAPTIYGNPQALMIHFQSYNNKVTISLAVDPTLISNPHQLCDDLEESLKLIKDAAIERGLKEKFN